MTTQEGASEARTGPLAGIRVLDVGWFIAGPVAATILGEFGADVIKVERPGRGDDLRHLGWLADGNSLWWSVEARNKRSITLNLAHPKGQAILGRLIRSADVLVENFTPGTMEKWGLGWDAVSAMNSRLIMLRTSGFGQTGPYSRVAAFNTAVESLGGLRYIMGEPDRPPARPGIALGDYTGALLGTIGVLLALFERDAAGSGQGQWIDNALHEAVLRITEYTIPGYQHLGRIRERVGGGSVGTVPARAFLGADGVWVGISAANDAMFGRLCNSMDHPEWAQDERFRTNAARIQHRDDVHALIERWCSERPSGEIVEVLQRAEVSAIEVMTSKALVADPHIQARQSVVEVPDPVFGRTLMQGVAPRLARTPGRVRHAGPVLGADNEAIYSGELGISPPELDALRAEGVI